MFRIHNLDTGQEQEFLNRDALLIGLEGEENRCLQLNISATFRVFLLDKHQNTLDSIDITIPPAGGQDVKELMGGFGLLQQEDKKHFWSRPSKNIKATNQQNKLQPAFKTSQVPVQKNNRFKSLTGFFLLVCILLIGLSLFLSLYSLKQTRQLSQAEAETTEKVTVNQAADVFSRYFISHYFSHSNNLEDFLSESIDADGLEVENVTPVSVLLEKQTEYKTSTTLTYVVGYRYDDETYDNKRLTLTVEKDKKTKYNYLVIKKPKLVAYP